MRKQSIALALAVFAMTSAMAADFAPGEVIVKYKSGIRRDRQTMQLFYSAMGVQDVTRFEGIMKGFERVKLAEGADVLSSVRQLGSDPLVEFAQPNYILTIQPYKQSATAMKEIPAMDAMSGLIGAFWGGGGGGGGSKPVVRPEVKPAPAEVLPGVADPALSKAYGLGKIGAPDAWKNFRSGAQDVIVGVIDTGVDYNHEDLSFNMWRNTAPTSNDTVGYDFVHNDGLPFDDNDHGSHCSGVIGAVGENGIGISGVAPRAKIMALKFLANSGGGTTADAIRAIDYGIAHGAKILSNSWGSSGTGMTADNVALKEAIVRAQAANVLFVVAAGNEKKDNDGKSGSSPAFFNLDNMIAVAATDSADDIAKFSNFGATTVHLGAPGVKVYSTTPGNTYKSFDGTSMAAPHVAGAAALVWSKHPTWTYKQVKTALLETVDPVAALKGKTSTGGRLNIAQAMLR